MRWRITWHPIGSDVTGTVCVEAQSAERARDYFEFHNPSSVVVTVVLIPEAE